MGGVIAVQEYFQVSVLGIWVDGGTITKLEQLAVGGVEYFDTLSLRYL